MTEAKFCVGNPIFCFSDNLYDVVWSQDAIVHSGDRVNILAEAYRVLKKGGYFLFTESQESM
ncbi:MAG: methyltransferase domain-containing protein [Potamolinea sp.]